jgi:protocadherin Fat 4
VTLPLPAGAASASLDYVAAHGGTVAAVGTEITASGQRRPFTAVSANTGATWTVALLPLPGGISAGSVTSATALTAAGGGFTATGTYGTPGGTDVVVWTLPAGAGMATGWTAVAPQGTGLAGPGAQAITALTATNATLIGVGFTTLTATATAAEPTIWQSPVRS